MAKSVLDIVIKLSKQGGADQETIKGLVQVKAALLQAAAVAGTMAAAGYTIKKAFDATVGVMVTYAEQVRDTQRATSLSAEESSKLIQMTDDLGVSYEGLSKAIKSSADSTDFSIEGLAKTSEEYLKLTNAQDRAKFAQQQYGKAWIEMVGVLEKGPDAIRAASSAVEESLILTDEAVRKAREYEIIVDNLSDTWQGFAVSLGTQALPVVNELLVAMQKNIDAGLSWRDVVLPVAFYDNIMALKDAHQELNPVVDSAAQSYTAYAEAAENGALSTTNLSGALDILEVNYSDILSMAQKMNDANVTYSEGLAQVNADTTLSVEERKVKLDELNAKYDESTNRIISDNLLQKLSIDGLTQAEFEKVIAFQEATGLISATAADQAVAINGIVQAAADGKISIDEMRDAIANLQDKTVTISVNYQFDESAYDAFGGGGYLGSLPNYASGTKGWETVPAGYPNDTYPIRLSSGEQFAVIPAGGGGGAASVSGAGGVTLNVNYAPALSFGNAAEAEQKMWPILLRLMQTAKANGQI
jgi:hypothetical protein